MARRNQYMMELERNKTVAKWTKHHGIVIDYITEAGNKRGYRPDFLVQRMDNTSSCTKRSVHG